MDNSNWLKELKIGDIFCTEKYGGYSIYKVKRITKTEIITEPFNNISIEGPRFNINTGRTLGGGSWNNTYAIPLTKELKEKIYKLKMIRKIKDYSDWDIFPIEKIIPIYNMITGEKNGTS